MKQNPTGDAQQCAEECRFAAAHLGKESYNMKNAPLGWAVAAFMSQRAKQLYIDKKELYVYSIEEGFMGVTD